MIWWALAMASPETLSGRPVASVTLEAPRGGLPRESLQPLFRAKQGEPYDPQHVRQDLTTLLRVGDFAAVEADAAEWRVQGADGEPVRAVALTYRVLPAPRVAKLRVQGQKNFSTRKTLDAAGVTTGQAFYPDLDGPIAAHRVQDWMRSQGWVEATVELDPVPLGDNRFELSFEVDEGRPNLLESLTFVGDLPEEVGEPTFRRWAREEKVRVGKPVSSEAIEAAVYRMRTRLGQVTGGLLTPARGWIGARITWTVDRNEHGGVALTIAVEPGPELEVVVRGLRWRPKRRVRDALGIDSRLRLTRGFIDEADERVEDALARKSFYRADAVVELRRGSETQTLFVEIDRGARHGLRGQPPRNSLRYKGNEAVNARALTRAADQASPKVIRLDRFTEDELQRGLKAMKGVYAAHGYLDAELTLEEVRDEPSGTPFTRPFLKAGFALSNTPLARRLVPVVRVVEGPLTLQGEVAIDGVPDDLEVADLRDDLAARVGKPLDPGASQRTARQLLSRAREAGYLQATVSVEPERLWMQAGPRVYLRSIAIRGSRHTQSWFIRRELALRRGLPLTTSDLDRSRRALYRLGIFRSVGIDLVGEGAARDVLITVTERARWGAEAGIGVNTDQGGRLFARAIRRNLWGIGHRLDAHGLFGLNYASESIGDWRPDFRTFEWRLALRYTAPRIPVKDTELILDILLRERLQERTWRMARTGAGVTVDLTRGRTKISTSARFELRDLQQFDRRALLVGEPWKFLDEAEEKGCHPCRLAESLRVVALHDRRNDPVQPTRGMVLNVIAELAPGIPWQQAELRSRFVKGSVRVAGFVPIGELLLQLSAEGGSSYGFAGSTLPLEDRYRLGGTGSMRGYALQSVGPRNRGRSVAVTWPGQIEPVLTLAEEGLRDRWVPTGGDTKALGVAELILPLPALGLGGWDGYAIAAFTDIGNVWHIGPGSPTRSGTVEPWIRSSVGLGARVSTPVGPLQLDVASNNQRMFSRPAMRQFLKESWQEPAVRAHLSLGSLW